MGDWFESLGPFAGGFLTVGSIVLITVIAGRLVLRFTHSDLLAQHNELAGFIYAVIGVIYAVVLGFVAIGVWERYIAAETRTSQEADALASIYRSAGQFQRGAALRRDLRVYVTDTISLEWPNMERGFASHDTDTTAERVALDVARLQPKDRGQNDLHSQMLANVDEAFADRDERLGEGSTGLNGVMWSVVFIGGFVTIAFSFIFGFQSPWLQTLMTGALALVVGLIIYLTLSLDYPFRGGIRVGPESFQRALTTFSQVDSLER
jgi:Protein of unknown function (DUF4239)